MLMQSFETKSSEDYDYLHQKIVNLIMPQTDHVLLCYDKNIELWNHVTVVFPQVENVVITFVSLFDSDWGSVWSSFAMYCQYLAKVLE